MTTTRPTAGLTSRARAATPSFLVAAFLALMIAFVMRYGLTLPYWDQWKFVPTLACFFDGDITFHDLWAQHNAHRIVVPRLVMLALAWLTRWNIAAELVVNVASAVVIFALLVAIARRMPSLRPFARLVPPAIALLVFSLAQWQNIVWGWQMQIFINVAAALAGLLVLTGPSRAKSPSQAAAHVPRLTLPRFLAAWCFGVVATYSFASGHAYWIAGLCVIPWIARAPARWMAAWAAGATVVIASYAVGFEVPSSHSSPGYAATHLAQLAHYAFTFIGGAVVSVSNPHRVSVMPSMVVGLLGVLSFAWMAIASARRCDDRARIAPLVGIALYVAGSALIAGIGRIDEGSAQALASRYTTIAAPFWVTWLLLACHTLVRAKARALRTALSLTIAMMLVAAAFNSARGAVAGSQRCRFALEARDALLRDENAPEARDPLLRRSDDELLQRLYPRPEDLRALRTLLQKHRLSVFTEN